MKRERLRFLVPLLVAVGACSDPAPVAPRPDVPGDTAADQSAPDVGDDVTNELPPAPDGDQPDAEPPPDAADDTPVTPDKPPPPDDVQPDVIVEPDVPPPPDVIVEPDVPPPPDAPPPPDVVVMPDVPPPPMDVMPPPDVVTPPDAPPPPDATPDVPVGPACPNGITDSCLPAGTTSRCADLNDGRPHTIVFTGFANGIAASCEGTGTGGGPDGIVPLTLTRPSSDITITNMPTGGATSVLALYRPSGCGTAAQEAACANSGVMGGTTLRATNLPPGTYWVQVSSNSGAATIVQATVAASPPRVMGDACPGVTVTPDMGPATVSTMGFAANGDYGTSCGGATAGNGDAVFTFTTTAARDVTVDVSATGAAAISAELTRTCGDRATAVPMCAMGNPARRTYRNLPAGTYYVTVAYGTGTRSLIASVTTAAATVPNAADACPGAPLTAGTAATVMVSQLTPGTAPLACQTGVTADGAWTFAAPAAGNDVLVNVASSNGNVGFQLQRPCGGTNVGACVGSAPSIWQRYTGLTAGATHAVVAGTNAGTGAVSVLYRTVPTPTTAMVTNNNACMTAQNVPATGGIFRGSTAMSNTRTGTGAAGTLALPMGCANATCLGARTVFYRLALTARSRVVATMTGEMNFDTLLFIRGGATCPGDNVAGACNDDRVGLNSQVDTTLNPGTYWILASGCGVAQQGNYTLDVAVLPPG
ncbi:MAG: hypothetical protein U0324_05205 [Polyangiales bacterium]